MAAAQEPVLIGVVLALTAAGMTAISACTLAGVARATFYRVTRGYRHYHPVTDPVPHSQRSQPAALTQAEQDSIIELLGRAEYADLSVIQTYWQAFDRGAIACSSSTFYRVARKAQLTGDRRRTRRGASSSARVKPIVPASKPNQLWTWDTTELRGPRNQDRYRLALILDVYSRYPVGWHIGYSENAADAKTMFTAALTAHGAPAVVHSDNGSAMRASELTSLLENTHHATMSYSRPRVSDDNPFSESMFKTFKYDLNCPDHFDSIEHAREWTEQYLHAYAHQHRHSGLNWHTPASVYHSTAHHVQQKRQQHLNQYYAAHPKRFRQPPQAPKLPEATGINTKPPHLSQTG
ncbi:Integrase catalytic region [Hoyosella subflava DQS3-9A1]|uniref:Integrase catalytic region n=1 Tax=Hoyosella subflava (strain DSM 45089 / JCM 17490 / NBRC 109087 / DQS3-9A1) TaxID=443218 RepID=F6EHR4_HOYSD|nr:Integrase catalytic region [Hoyosella subflava DQS3-9A1]